MIYGLSHRKILLQQFFLDRSPIPKNKFQIYTFFAIAISARARNDQRRVNPPLIYLHYLFALKKSPRRCGPNLPGR
jgi:hypothetical protein